METKIGNIALVDEDNAGVVVDLANKLSYAPQEVDYSKAKHYFHPVSAHDFVKLATENTKIEFDPLCYFVLDCLAEHFGINDEGKPLSPFWWWSFGHIYSKITPEITKTYHVDDVNQYMKAWVV